MVATRRGEDDRATELFEDGLALQRQLGDRWMIARSLRELGESAARRGDVEQAGRLLEEALALHREVGIKAGVGGVLRAIGRVTRARGDLDQARRLFEESLAALRDAGDRGGVAASLDELANLARDQGAPARAARLFGAAYGLRLAIGTSLPPVASAEQDREVAALEADLGETAFAAAWREGRAMSFEQAVAYALGTATVT